jgi:hypothetical protein
MTVKKGSFDEAILKDAQAVIKEQTGSHNEQIKKLLGAAR